MKKTQTDGDDLLFIDPDANQVLQHYFELYDSTGQEAYIWVKIPQIDASSTNDYIYMYYGDPTADANRDESGVYTSDVKGVWHGEEGTGTTVGDSTSNSRDGTTNTSIWSASTTHIGKNVLNPAGTYNVDISNNADWYNDTFTVSMWVNSSEVPSGENDTIMGSYDNGDNGWKLQYDSGGPKLMFRTSGSTAITYSTTLTVGNWFHLAIVRDNSTGNGRIYKDGMLVSNGTLDAPSNPNNSLYFAVNGEASDPYEGRIDEVKFYSSAKSLAWIRATYKSEVDSFLTFATEESKTGGGGGGGSSTARATVWGDLEIKGTLYGGSPLKVGSGLKVTGGPIEGFADNLKIGTIPLNKIINNLHNLNAKQAQRIQELEANLTTMQSKLDSIETTNPQLLTNHYAKDQNISEQ